MKTLDKSKPYGKVYGFPQGHSYEQGGLKFDQRGYQVGGQEVREMPEIKDEPAAVNYSEDKKITGHICPVCQFEAKSRLGLRSHMRKHR